MRTTPDPVAEEIGRELELVESAIAMVVGGHARRMQLGSLAYGTAILPSARAMAAASGVRMLPAWSLDDHLTGIVFERAGEPGPTGD